MKNKISSPSQRKNTTLCFLVRNDQVLLAMKKRDFGKGKWNGVGGKVIPPETPEQAAIRETKEEVNSEPIRMEQVSLLTFDYPHAPEGKDWDQTCYVYVITEWVGEPSESDEMMPKWFPKTELPFDTMWPDDPYWLPKILEGKKITAHFTFDAQFAIIDSNIKEGLRNNI